MTSRPLKPVVPGRIVKEKRNAVRIVVDWKASIAVEGFGVQDIRITDSTNRGCRVETDLGVTVGTFVVIAIPSFTDVQGWVAWSGPSAMGVDFAHPLPSRVLEYLVQQCDPI